MTKYGGCLISEEILNGDEVRQRLASIGFILKPIEDCIVGGTYLSRAAEAVVGPDEGTDFGDALITQFVRDVGTTKCFTIIDRYLLTRSPDPQNYVSRLLAILNPILQTLDELVLIIGKADPLVQSVLQNRIAYNHRMSISILKSNHFHDRFWFGDGDKGFIVGTSLNGIGKKYSLVDWLDPIDVGDIRRKLLSLHLK